MRSADIVRVIYSASGPLVQGDSFLKFHEQAIPRLIGRAPTCFERATAHAVWKARTRMPTSGSPVAFTAVTAATGGGKSNAACVLIAYLAEQGKPCAYVVEAIEAVEEFRLKLDRLLPGQVAAYSTLHRSNASPNKVRDYAEQGITVAAQFTEEEFASALVVVTTHDRWKRDLEHGGLGVVQCDGADRSLVIVDEEPELQVVYARQPEDVSALASALADHVVADDARHFGFTTDHHASDALLAIHDRMFSIKANVNQAQVRSAEIVTAADLDMLSTVTRADLSKRLSGSSRDRVDFLYDTVEFLRAASQGRVFYSKSDDGAFYAYAMRLPVRHSTIILDGTADLNGLYAVGKHVIPVESERASYGPAKLYAVQPPAEFVGRMKSNGIFASDARIAAYMEWFIPFLLENTEPGQEVLVYAKKALLSYGVHMRREYNDGGTYDRRKTSLQGRIIHWCSFGRGRGLNDWRNCSVYFRLGDFHMKTAVAMATVGSLTQQAYTPAELRNLSSQRHRHPVIGAVMQKHLAVSNKQDAARIRIRQLDDSGACRAARLYMVDCDLALLTKHRESMFPGSDEYTLIGYKATREGTPSAAKGGAARLALVLLTVTEEVLDVTEACRLADLRPDLFARTITSHAVSDAMQARGWRVLSRREAGLDGRGKVLIRS